MIIICRTILLPNNKIGIDAIFIISSILEASLRVIPDIKAPITIPAQHNNNINNNITVCNITINVLF